MSKEDLKEKFLALRIQGRTFEAIAKELSVSKQTLINWSKEDEIKEAILTAKLMRYQSILAIYKQNREAKIEYFAELSKKAKEELSKRDLSELSVDKLFKLVTDAEEKLSDLIPTYQYGGSFLELDILETYPSFTLDPED